jgi:hypothetical protein
MGFLEFELKQRKGKEEIPQEEATRSLRIGLHSNKDSKKATATRSTGKSK